MNTDSREASLKLKCEAENTRFEWENWINAAMGLLKGWNERVMDRREDDFEGPSGLVKPAQLSRGVLELEPPHAELPKLAGKILVWTGWPMFDVRVCQFENDQWMATYGLLPEDAEEQKFEHAQRRYEAREGLEIIAMWNRV